MLSGSYKTTRLPELPRFALTFVGLTAVIVGILAMHVWMGGHGPTAAHGSSAASTSVMTGLPTSSSGSHDDGHLHHEDAGFASIDTTTAAVADPPDSGIAHSCTGPCVDGMAVGMCVLALLVVTLLSFLLPASRPLPGAVLLRVDRRVRILPLAIPAPSLIRLCISRT
ncbi:hypothetical protein BJ994_001292 [Arthrobacter pigmenti]|uniref:Uncharacterized protein n=1 Tax=Arthrobacter pigmenti TaxID=271432 RepID=A0A846RT17_9MICC|nr:hypothetical protein [Arthrobacter pigmenti]NJC22216.1 hypothetical protein [Arthrobacter pigmenti]